MFGRVKVKRKGFVSELRCVKWWGRKRKGLKKHQRKSDGGGHGVASGGTEPRLWSAEHSVTRNLIWNALCPSHRDWEPKWDWLYRNHTHTHTGRHDGMKANALTKQETKSCVSLMCIVSFLPPTGVHCTHGFNRTGFLICTYLVEKMDWRWEAVGVLYRTCVLASFTHLFLIRPKIETLKDSYVLLSSPYCIVAAFRREISENTQPSAAVHLKS